MILDVLMRWFKGTFTGNYGFDYQNLRFPLIFSLKPILGVMVELLTSQSSLLQHQNRLMSFLLGMDLFILVPSTLMFTDVHPHCNSTRMIPF